MRLRSENEPDFGFGPTLSARFESGYVESADAVMLNGPSLVSFKPGVSRPSVNQRCTQVAGFVWLALIESVLCSSQDSAAASPHLHEMVCTARSSPLTICQHALRRPRAAPPR